MKGGLTQDWKGEDAGVAWIREKDLKKTLQKSHAFYTSHQGESLRSANHRTPEGRHPGRFISAPGSGTGLRTEGYSVGIEWVNE